MSSWDEEPVVFACGDDELVGILHRGAAPIARCGVLVIVGGPQYRIGSHRQFTVMARALAAARIPVLRFDYRSLGDSSGEARTFEQISEDIAAAVDAFCRAVPALQQIVLWGLCDAASAIMMSARTHERVAGWALVNPESRTSVSEAQAYVRHYYVQRLLQRSFWRKVFSGQVNPLASAAGLFGTLRQAMARGEAPADARAVSYVERMLRGLQQFPGPVMIFLSGRDLTARAFESLSATAGEWQRALAAKRIHYHRLPEADHTFSARVALDEATGALIQWLRESLG